MAFQILTTASLMESQCLIMRRTRARVIPAMGKMIVRTMFTIFRAWIAGLVEGIKNIWNGIIGFFSGLWEAMKQGPVEALEYIRNAFFGLFDAIKEKFFEFINVLKDGFDKVKGFFGGIKDGVVNFFTGGDKEENKDRNPPPPFDPRDDRDQGNTLDAMRNFFGGPQLQPAFAGAPAAAAAPLTARAMQSAAANNNYSNIGGNTEQTINAQSTINVSVPPGTSAEQAQAISRQIDKQFQENFASVLTGARGTIPSPEARRN
jgi:hypothetical protein